jgi:hypothetical protein
MVTKTEPKPYAGEDRRFLAGYGFSDAEINLVYDPRLIRLIRDARLALAAKPRPKS